jgi:hypothetical protein
MHEVEEGWEIGQMSVGREKIEKMEGRKVGTGFLGGFHSFSVIEFRSKT